MDRTRTGNVISLSLSVNDNLTLVIFLSSLASSDILRSAVLLQRSRLCKTESDSVLRRCVGAGGDEAHDALVTEAVPCPGKASGCAGQQLCMLHSLVRRCMHSVQLINRAALITDTVSFHDIHQRSTTRFHHTFNYHRGPQNRTQFLMPLDWNMKNQDPAIYLTWLALVFKPIPKERTGGDAAPGWYDTVCSPLDSDRRVLKLIFIF